MSLDLHSWSSLHTFRSIELRMVSSACLFGVVCVSVPWSVSVAQLRPKQYNPVAARPLLRSLVLDCAIGDQMLGAMAPYSKPSYMRMAVVGVYDV